MAKRDCPLCDELMEDAPIVHDLVLCEKTELFKGRIEIQKLKQSVKNWLDEWYKYRDLLSYSQWHHEAIADDSKRAYYQNNLKEIAEINKE